MKCLVPLVVTAAAFAIAPAQAIEFWHSNTVWAGQGMCAATFTFDSGMDRVEDLAVLLSMVDSAGNKTALGVLEIPEFGGSSASRYDQVFLESEEVCADDLWLVVDKATAVVEGKPVDLLKDGGLSVRDFRPFRVRVGE